MLYRIVFFFLFVSQGIRRVQIVPTFAQFRHALVTPGRGKRNRQLYNFAQIRQRGVSICHMIVTLKCAPGEFCVHSLIA
jgi:hypothetical protein